jgi:hypothetical protein
MVCRGCYREYLGLLLKGMNWINEIEDELDKRKLYFWGDLY